LKIEFERLDYQTDAVNSAINVFEGERVKDSQFTISLGNDFQGSFFTDDGVGIANKQTITKEKMLDNVQKVQLANKIPQSDQLFGNNKNFPEFNIEMETGTGKTFVYFKSILELNQKYGFKKFIVVVPSVAIKEGVLKTYQMTKEKLSQIFHGTIYNLFAYDSNHPERVQQFASANTIDIMVITMSSFNKEAGTEKDKKGNVNVIYRENDRLAGQRPIDLISETRPILIIDEPQVVDNTDKAKQALSNLNPLVAFRYSATHKDQSYPTIYRLNAVDAYREKLVKQIEVSSVNIDQDGNEAYVWLKSTELKNSKIKAKLEVYKKTKDDADKAILSVKKGDNLAQKTKLPAYESLGDVVDIDTRDGKETVYFSGEPQKITLKSATHEDLEEKRMQLRAMIKSHLDKELSLINRGIKVLSLIFLDHVDNYRTYDKNGNPQKGRYAQIFEQEYRRLIELPMYESLNDRKVPVEEVHRGYFARDGKGKMKNSTKGESLADESEYQIIMKNKEGLLTMYDGRKHTTSANKTRFIFSHSALKEGWDNPNIFQIATLVDTKDTITKRQKIGRGMRIAVNQQGKRVPGFDVNTLTVIANESYADFANSLQKEYEDDGFQFGLFSDDVFSIIITKQGKTLEETETLGKKQSKKLVHELKERGYINNTNHATDELKKAIKNKKIDLPAEYKPYEEEILKIAEEKTANLHIKDAKQKVQVKLNKEALSNDFLSLWDRIKNKTTYHIDFSTQDLIQYIVYGAFSLDGLNSIHVNRGQYFSETGTLGIDESGISISEEKPRHNYSSNGVADYPLPDIITYLQNETDLTRKTIVTVLKKANNLDLFKKNPISYLTQAVVIINAVKNQLMINGIKYEKKDNDFYDQKLFSSETLYAYLDDDKHDGNAVKVNEGLNKTVYDYIVADSEIEKDFAKDLEKDDNVKFYIKMPAWFRVPTPLGDYNPDWAVFREEDEGQKLYFVADTKGNKNSDQLRPHEKGKLRAGKKSFEALDTGITFRTVTKEEELN
jgi:type III restriction enzyme